MKQFRIIWGAEQRSEFPNVFHVIESQYALNQLRTHFVAEHRSHQLACLGHYFFGRHRVLRRPAHMLDTLAELRPVGESDFDDSYSNRNEPLEFFIGNELNFLT